MGAFNKAGEMVKQVTIGGIIYDTRDMDEAIGLLMKARADRQKPFDPMDNKTIETAVSTIKAELAKMELMDIAKNASEKHRSGETK
jgi:hypothetical protein